MNGRTEVCLSTGRDARFRPGQRPWNATVGNTALAAAPAPIRSGAFQWAQSLGLLGCRADCKRVPAVVFALADDNIALLLGRLWSGDGFFIGPSNTVPYYASSSEGLARDVQDLLLRLGIVSRIQTTQFKYRNGRRTGYAVYLIGEDSLRRFREEVIPHCVGREAQITAYKTRGESVPAGLSTKDTVPAAVRRWVDAARCENGINWRKLEAASNVSMREFYGGGSVAKRGFRRTTVTTLAAFFGSERLRSVGESDVYWDTVVEIVPRGVDDVYDLEIEGDHNFVADGLIVHNSHAAAYALIAFQTAYMKAHHPASFMAANLSAVMDDTDKVQHFYLDAVANGLRMLPPDINASDYRFVPVDERTIRYGLGAVKGTGEAAINAIVQARAAGGPFTGLADFCERVDKRIVNRRAIEALVRAGAFDAIDDHRARLAASLGIALEAAEQASRDARQVSLFGAAEQASRSRPAYVEAPRWDERRRLAEEKTALGFYLSGHPFGEYRRELARFVRGTLADLQPRNEPVVIAGSVAAARTAMTRRGKMAVVMLDDGTAQAEVAVYNELWDARRDTIKQDRPLVVQGKVVKDEFTGGLRVVADKLWDLAGARTQFARGIRLALNGDASANGAVLVGRLRELLAPYRNGSCPVKVCYANGKAIAELMLGEAWRVTPADALIDELKAWLKPDNVEVVYQ